MVQIPKSILTAFWLLTTWSSCHSIPKDAEGMRLAKAWCICVDSQRDRLSHETIRDVWLHCDSLMMDSARYFVYYYKNMGVVTPEIERSFSTAEFDSLWDAYDSFSHYRDSMCPMVRYGDSLIAPRIYPN